LLTYAIMSDSIIVAYVQFKIMLIELKKYSVRNYSVCVLTVPQSYRNKTYQKQWMTVSHIFTALETNKSAIQKYMYTIYMYIY